jgi:hypothetical protein
MQTSTHLYRNQKWNSELPTNDSAQTLVLAFAARTFDADTALWQQIKDTYPNSVIAGCSSAGEICDDLVYDDTLSLAVTHFEHTKLRFASSVIANTSSTGVGADIAQQLNHEGLKAVLILSDGLGVNGSELAFGMRSGLPTDVVVTGGLAGDGANFQQTWTLVDGLPTKGMVTAVGFYGDAVQVGYGSKGGWDLFGPERMVTKSSANIVYELDNKPALVLYKEYLGDLASGLPATGLMFPLALKTPEEDEPIVRTLLAIDEEAQSLIFAGDIPEGKVTQLMRANFDRLIEGAEIAAAQISNKGAAGEHLSIAISCVGRKLILKERIDEEVEATLDALPANTKQVGFYSYGELSPRGALVCRLHNQTMTLTLISED